MDLIIGSICILLSAGCGFFLARKIDSKNSISHEELIAAEKEISSLQSKNLALEEKVNIYKEEVQEKLHLRFENIANKIFEKKSEKIQSDSEQNLSRILSPLKEKIQEFQKKVEDTYQSESRERFALKSEIERIVEVNQKMQEETSNLTQALKGSVKAQGNWGEVVLSRILETSGLREGEEYTIQGKGLDLKTEDGRLQQPDVVINLPDEKHIIVDSKVSLLHYEKMIAAQNQEDKDRMTKSFIQSLQQHVDGLSSKKYQHSEKLISPDFVLMFFPIEGAFSLALQEDPQLFTRAWEKSIVIVSPTTLLATLRTVASIWKQELQNRNVMKIAVESGRLYDKFVGFVTDLEKIGDNLKKTENTYTDAMNKLHTGKGNIVSKIEGIKKLGAKASKQLPEHLILDTIDNGEIHFNETPQA